MSFSLALAALGLSPLPTNGFLPCRLSPTARTYERVAASHGRWVWANADDLAWASKTWRMQLCGLRGKVSLWEGGLFGRLMRSGPEAIAETIPPGSLGRGVDVDGADTVSERHLCVVNQYVRVLLVMSFSTPYLLAIRFFLDWVLTFLLPPPRQLSWHGRWRRTREFHLRERCARFGRTNQHDATPRSFRLFGGVCRTYQM